jgi:hypothetical protein
MNEKPNDGGAAFPSGPMGDMFTGDDGRSWHQWPGTCGMSLRDYFAAAALQGIRSANLMTRDAGKNFDRMWSSDSIAQLAYADADAMLKAREK